jgi:hypothetical protein
LRDAALVRNRYVAVQHHGPSGIDKLAERRAEEPGVIERCRLSSFSVPSPAMMAISAGSAQLWNLGRLPRFFLA